MSASPRTPPLVLVNPHTYHSKGEPKCNFFRNTMISCLQRSYLKFNINSLHKDHIIICNRNVHIHVVHVIHAASTHNKKKYHKFDPITWVTEEEGGEHTPSFFILLQPVFMNICMYYIYYRSIWAIPTYRVLLTLQ